MYLGISTVTHVTFSFHMFQIAVVETYIFKTWIANFFFMCK